MLFNYFWTWGLLWSVVNISRDLPLEKTDFPFARGYQLQITWLEMGPHVYFLLSVLGPCLARAHAGLVDAATIL